MIDRSVQPEFIVPQNLTFEEPAELKLSNGGSIYTYEKAGSGVVKIELLFEAGEKYQSVDLQAKLTSLLIGAGTIKMTAEEIENKLDFYGAYYKVSCEKDTASVIVFTLSRYVREVMEIVHQMVFDASLPQDEFKLRLDNSKMKFKVNMEKVSYVARLNYLSLVFGEHHPYAGLISESSFDSLQLSQLHEFYKNAYQHGKFDILVSGDISQLDILFLEELFEREESPGMQNIVFPELHFTPQRIHLEKQGAIQTAIRMGGLSIDRKNEDYPHLKVLNTVLGGYFGSRLMSNIREDKGYTYGIGSGIINLEQGDYFVIATEVGKEVANDAIMEIEKELTRLMEESIPQDELEEVVNYMLGILLRSGDGVFAQMNLFKVILRMGLTTDYYTDYIHSLHDCTPERIKQLAQIYLNPQNMAVITAG